MDVAAYSIEDASERWWVDTTGAAVTPFLSWPWVRALRAVSHAGREPRVLKAEDGGRVAGVTALGRGSEKRAKVVRSRVAYFNESGDRELDRLLVEHNRVLAQPGREAEVLGAMLDYMVSRVRAWDEVSLGWMDRERWESLAASVSLGRLRPLVRESQPYYFVDLSAVDSLDAYLTLLRSNTRQQLRRAMRGFAESGPLEYAVAASPEQALGWFEELEALHQDEWQRRGKPGAFASPRIQAFHRAFLPEAVPRGLAEIARVKAGDKTVGFLYNLSDGLTLYNYQSGLAYSHDSRLKPGFVAHALAIADAGQRGLRRYDLLMGDSQYKRSLSTGQGEMVRVVLQKARLRFAIERGMRRLRGRFVHGDQ